MFAQGLHWCEDCGQFLPVENFVKRARSRYGLAFHCKRCDLERRKKYRTKERVLAYQKEKKQYFVELMGGRCCRCGYDEFTAGMDFHHIDPNEKDVIRFSNVGRERMKEELDKCVLLCSCCHNALHANEWSAEFVKRNGLGWTIGVMSSPVKAQCNPNAPTAR
jgi:hypothetical protein